MAYSPGIWSLERPRHKRRLTAFQKTIEHGEELIIMTPNGHRVCIVDGPSNLEKHEEFLSNAYLLRAAPQIFKVLKAGRLMLHAWLASLDNRHPELERTILEIEEVIAQARGEI